jgi:hypothetical protein
MKRRRMGVVASVVALAIGGFLPAAAPASADSDQSRAQGVSINVTGDGSHASISNRWVHPGWLKLNIKDSTSPTLGAQVVVVQMRRHYSVKRLVADINVQGQPATTLVQLAAAAASTRDINKIAIALAGGDTVGGKPWFRSDVIWLPEGGEYFVLNTGAKSGVAVVGRLEAGGRTVYRGAPDYSGTVSLGNGSTDTITLRGHMWARGTIKVRNNGDSVHLLSISKVADTATDTEVSAEYAYFMTYGHPPTPDPAGLFGPPTAGTGSDAVSPGHSSLLSYNLPKGTYLLQCFVADDVSGIPHAFMGMHLIVHVG